MLDPYLDSLNSAIKLNALALADAGNDSEIDTYTDTIYSLSRETQSAFSRPARQAKNLQNQQKKAAIDAETSKAVEVKQ